MKARTLLLALPLLLLAGCGTELGRVPFNGEGTGSSTVTLAAGDVDFWTDLSIEYTGDAALAYEIELSQDGAQVAKLACDPLGRFHVKTSWVESNFNGAHSRSGNGKMTCSVKLAKGGPTLVKAKLAFSRKPASGGIKQADLVVKQ